MNSKERLRLKEKEEKSIHIIREAHALFPNSALMWSMGKDSAVLLWLARKAFLGRIPFPVINVDTTFEFKELIKFRDTLAKEWKLNLVVSKPEKPNREILKDPVAFFHHHKTIPFLSALKKLKSQAVYLGIRGDEHGIRAKERYFSLRNAKGELDFNRQAISVWNFYPRKLPNDFHFRIHPLLHWTEMDIWEYIEQEKIPLPPLYFSKKGWRYRSLDCEIACEPMKSRAKNVREIIKEIKTLETYERQGRAQDKENIYAMEKLRSLGYM
jgi:sulfate adenylyltransferase subunit 2